MFIDCGYTSGGPISANPHRFIDHLTPRLEAETGITVEWFLPSHYHDDHLAGLPTLQVKFGRDEIFSWRDFQFRMEQSRGRRDTTT